MAKVVLTVTEAGKLLGLSKNSVYEAVKRGEIPSIRFNGRIVVPLGKLAEILGEESDALAERLEKGQGQD